MCGSLCTSTCAALLEEGDRSLTVQAEYEKLPPLCPDAALRMHSDTK